MKKWCLAVALLLAFVVWTGLVSVVDVGAIGPNGSSVGFSALNGWFHEVTGVHMILYHVTDWMGLVPVAVGFAFAILGLCQWIHRRRIDKVDFSILALGVFYLVTIGAYLLFEYVVINYRPVLISGFLEASYPSSTTLLVLCVMPTALVQTNRRIRRHGLRQIVQAVTVAFILFMVVGRLVSGVHWLSDIVGGILLSGGLVSLYTAAIQNRK